MPDFTALFALPATKIFAGALRISTQFIKKPGGTVVKNSYILYLSQDLGNLFPGVSCTIFLKKTTAILSVSKIIKDEYEKKGFYR
jgi:hypothetical protein